MDIVKILWRSVMGALVVSLVGLVSCGHHGEEDRLGFDRIDELCDSVPEVAISMLDSIDYGSLTEKERHHYDLLRIKALDKAYVIHTSDSLIKDVIDYYSRHKDSHLWPVALYYGGRVYSDLGDYPHALEYFQQAVDAMPDTTKNLAFRANVLSQTGRLLNELRSFSQAIPYLEKSVEISEQLDDQFGITFDNILLSGIYIHLSDFKNAEKHIDKALKHSSTLSDSDKAIVLSYHATVLYYQNMIDSSLRIIRTLPSVVDERFNGYTVAIAAKTYLAAGITDTAYMYAKQLAFNGGRDYKFEGFSLLFDDRLKKYIPNDSLQDYTNFYSKETERKLNTHDSQEALISNSKYNYRQHEKKRIEAEKSSKVFKVSLVSACLLCLGVLVLLMHIFRQKRRVQTERDDSEEKLMTIEKDYTNVKKENDCNSKTILQINAENEKLKKSLYNAKLEPTLQDKIGKRLKQKMLSQFMEISVSDSNFVIPEKLTQSEAYIHLGKMIEENKIITDSNYWLRLSHDIEEQFPNFKYKLQVLTEGLMTDTDYQVALLIRCNISPGNCAKILGIRKNSVSSRRSMLASKIFNTPTDKKYLDRLIQSL